MKVKKVKDPNSLPIQRSKTVESKGNSSSHIVTSNHLERRMAGGLEPAAQSKERRKAATQENTLQKGTKGKQKGERDKSSKNG